jgi:hypothetical protein
MDEQKKPPHGSACTRCGYCCRSCLCPLAIYVLHPGTDTLRDVKGPCPMLEAGPDGKPVCGLAVYPATYVPILAKRVGNATLARAASFLIGSDVGCDTIAAGEAENIGYSLTLAARANREVDKFTQAWRIWGRNF